jgi:hypothetical protein
MNESVRELYMRERRRGCPPAYALRLARLFVSWRERERAERGPVRCMCGAALMDSDLVDIGDGLPRCPHCGCH